MWFRISPWRRRFRCAGAQCCTAGDCGSQITVVGRPDSDLSSCWPTIETISFYGGLEKLSLKEWKKRSENHFDNENSVNVVDPFQYTLYSDSEISTIPTADFTISGLDDGIRPRFWCDSGLNNRGQWFTGSPFNHTRSRWQGITSGNFQYIQNIVE